MTLIKRFGIALVVALALAGATLLIARAQTSPVRQAQAVPAQAAITPTTQPPAAAEAGNCASCHKETNEVWQAGPHGRAGTSDVFREEWQAQGQPGACLVCHTTGYDPATGKWEQDGVACTSCHNPVPANHPTDHMPVDTSSDLCGKCHSDPSFGAADWKASAHYQRGMTCSVCHDAHSAGMKSVVGVRGTRPDASALCVNCHKDAMQNFPTSKHAQAGVTCVNCHLGFNSNNKNFAEAHKVPGHSFLPSLDTCGKCHADQMHAPGQAVAAAAIKAEHVGGTPTPEPTAVVTAIPSVSAQPTPVSPLGYAGIAGLLGLAGGVVLAPWLERSYRRFMVEGGKQ